MIVVDEGVAVEIAAPMRAEEPRVDAVAKVTGQAQYVEDLPELPDMAFAALLRSPYSHARIRSIDTSAAEAISGVLGILHGGNLDGLSLNLDPNSTDQDFLARGKARYDGDPMAMVAAVDRLTVEQALQAIRIDWEILPEVFSVDEALAPGAPLVHEQLPNNMALEGSLAWGDVEQGLREADRVFHETYISGNVNHHPMEPAGCLLVRFGSDRLEFWLPTNNAFRVAEEASALFGIPPERIRVRVPYVGGNFGGKDTNVEAMVAAALSRKVGRPLRVIATAGETLRVSSRHAMVWDARIGVTAGGRITAMDIDLKIDTGAYFTAAEIATRNAVRAAFGAYRTPNLRVRSVTCYTNKVPSGTFRNTGKTQTTFGSDCAMDSIARQMGIDPIEFRLQNVYAPGEPVGSPSWSVFGEEAPAPKPMDTDLPVLIRKAVDMMGWQAPRPPSGDGSKALGRGLGVSLRQGSEPGRAEAEAWVDASGVVTITHNAPEVGGGSHTVISVVAAETLGIPRSQVRVSEPDTASQLRFAGTSSQRTTIQMGTAVELACRELLHELAKAAAEARGGAPEDWLVEGGRLRHAGDRFDFAEIARLSGRTVRGRGAFPPASPARGLNHWAPGVAAAEIELDRDTGQLRVLRYVALADAGKVLHYHSAKGQIEGGATMGFGIALFEDLRYEDGQLLNGDQFQYKLPSMADVPQQLDLYFEENGDGPGPFGAKAVAQVSISCVAPALGNAICDATGVRLRATPFTPEKVLRELGAIPA
jgi:CO/xanthine dehydrogenase Mo-binding subunit